MEMIKLFKDKLCIFYVYFKVDYKVDPSSLQMNLKVIHIQFEHNFAKGIDSNYGGSFFASL